MSYSTSQYPYDCVCYVIATLSDGKSYQGSAAIIGAHTILTASHMLWDATDGAKVTALRIYPGYQQGGAALITTWTAHYNTIDDSNGLLTQSQSQKDFAIIDVSADLSKYGAFGITTNYGGGAVHVTGYPASEKGVQTDTIGTVTANPLWRILDYGSATSSPGNSGGPIWIASDSPSIVGVVSTGSWGVQLTTADMQIIQGWQALDGLATSTTVVQIPTQSYAFGANSLFIAPSTGAYQVQGSGLGVDTVIFSKALAQFTVMQAPNGNVTVDPHDGSFSATLVGVQQAKFTDYILAFDLHSSQDLLVYELYQAAYGRIPDNGGYRYWAELSDAQHYSAQYLADAFLAAPEFAQKYGANPSNQVFVTELYANVLGRQPDAGGLNYWVAQANAGAAHDSLLIAFATSAENVNLVGAHTGNGYWTTF